MYHFTPPKKHKKIYILINVLIILLIISITAFFHDRIEIFGIPIALWCLFNGLWSVNANWYSWFHRNDKSSSSHGFWLICLITGLAMSILLLLIHLLMWFVTPFYCSYLHLHTFLLLFHKKRTKHLLRSFFIQSEGLVCNLTAGEYVIAAGVWHHALACIYPSDWCHTSLRDDSIRSFVAIPYRNKLRM